MRINIDDLGKVKASLIEDGFPSDTQVFLRPLNTYRRVELIIEVDYSYLKNASGIVVIPGEVRDGRMGRPSLYNSLPTVLRGLKLLNDNGLPAFTAENYAVVLDDQIFSMLGDDVWLPLTYCKPMYTPKKGLVGLSLHYYLGNKDPYATVDWELLCKQILGKDRQEVVSELPKMRKRYENEINRRSKQPDEHLDATDVAEDVGVPEMSTAWEV